MGVLGGASACTTPTLILRTEKLNGSLPMSPPPRAIVSLHTEGSRWMRRSKSLDRHHFCLLVAKPGACGLAHVVVGPVAAVSGIGHWLSYSSWRRHQKPVSLRPRGARSSHWYMPQRLSSPRS